MSWNHSQFIRFKPKMSIDLFFLLFLAENLEIFTQIKRKILIFFLLVDFDFFLCGQISLKLEELQTNCVEQKKN